MYATGFKTFAVQLNITFTIDSLHLPYLKYEIKKLPRENNHCNYFK